MVENVEGGFRWERWVVQARLIPPQPRDDYLRRPRLENRLREGATAILTLVKANPGYGKSTAVAQAMRAFRVPFLWYNLSPSDADPLVFLAHLLFLFRSLYPQCGAPAARWLERYDGTPRHAGAVVEALIDDLAGRLSEDVVLVLDDYHLVDCRDVNALMERLIGQAPPRLHVFLITRHTPRLSELPRWQVYKEVVNIGTSDLAFTPEEVQELFALNGVHLTPPEAARLAAETEGWVIALQVVLQHLKKNNEQQIERLLRQPGRTLRDLFVYLAQEVFGQQPPEIQEFLLQTSILDHLEERICQAVTGNPRAGEILKALNEQSLFVADQGRGFYRYHHLFQECLLDLAKQRFVDLPSLHRRAAEFHLKHDRPEAAIPHLLHAGEFRRAAEVLSVIGADLIYRGQYVTCAQWVDRLPENVLNAFPGLLLQRGDAARFLSRFQEALFWYQRAAQQARAQGNTLQEMRALRGQITVYLDTLQPALAEPLLAQVMRQAAALPPHERGRLLFLKVENLLNAGHLEQAARLFRRLERVCSAERVPDIRPRLLARLGHLEEARLAAEELLREGPWGGDGHRVPRANREAAVLLAWINALMGKVQQARHFAEQGVQVGQQLQAPGVECIAFARLGHTWLIGPYSHFSRAEEHYRQSLYLAEAIHVPRVGVEALIGLALVEGMKGSVWNARSYILRALNALQEAGDKYMMALAWLVLGIAGALNEYPESASWLKESQRLSETCGAHFLACVARLWLAWIKWRTRRRDWKPALAEVLTSMEQYRYDFLLTTPTLLGFRRIEEAVMLLRAAFEGGIRPPYTATLLREAMKKLPIVQVKDLPATVDVVGPWMTTWHEQGEEKPLPLFVQTLGPFRVWRGWREISRRAWGRHKALFLFHYMLIHRRRAVRREELLEMLWPNKDPHMAANSLRVALNALHQVLEPERRPGEPPFYVQRDGEFFYLNPDAVIDVDVDLFERYVAQARELEASSPEEALSLYKQALMLYQGDFLEGYPYEEWAMVERDRLLGLYLNVATSVANALVSQKQFEEAMSLAYQILRRDVYWEEAYAVLIKCYAALGQRSMVLRTYERCRRVTADLGVEPSPALQKLFQEVWKEGVPRRPPSTYPPFSLSNP